MKKLIGIDIGGTSVKLAIINKTGTIIEKWTIITNSDMAGIFIVDDIIESISIKLPQLGLKLEDIIAIGVGVPGPVDESNVKRAVNLGWKDYPLKDIFEKKLDVHTVLINDANAAALGELWKGSFKSIQNAIFVTLGTGVGGGIIVNGKIINGKNFSGGEIGHIPVISVENRLCGCGNTNCLECFASANGMVSTMNQLLTKNEKKPIRDAKEIFQLLEDNSWEATKTLEITIDFLARSLASIINILDPEEVIIGGGVSDAGENLLQPLRIRVNELLFPQIRNNVIIRKATQGNDAGVYGAAYQAMTSYGDEE